MKLRTIVKIAITSSVVLLCSGFALYSFFRLSAAEGQKDFDLYELVPSTTSAVFVTDDVLEFVAEVDDLTCSKNQQYLYVSKLFSYLKQSLYALSEDTPHGLSRQMNQMLISFHEPDNERNQVLYCRLGNGDKGTIRQELEKYPALTLSVVRKVIIDIRESKLPDPKVMGNAGSFFMNPIVPKEKLEALQQEYPRIPYYELAEDRVKIPAGWMIDQCGWKGKALGPAAVHDKQALVLVNLGGAKGSDILALSDAVRASVHEKFGIDIHPEVNLIN